MSERKTWKEFRDSGMLFLVNQILFIFGWAIVIKKDELTDEIYPIRTEPIINEEAMKEGYRKISAFLKGENK